MSVGIMQNIAHRRPFIGAEAPIPERVRGRSRAKTQTCLEIAPRYGTDVREGMARINLNYFGIFFVTGQYEVTLSC